MKFRRILGLFALAFLTLSYASATERSGVSNGYLALGDSVPFGYFSLAGFQYGNAENFVGYPDWTAIALGLGEADAACPGETTGSFLSPQAPDNGCRLYRTHAPLHVNYGTAQTQFDYALSYLQQNGGTTSLVSLQLGSNDLLLLQQACNNDPQCIAAGLPGVLATVTTNIATILGGLRGTGYRGPIVVADYYSPDYSNLVFTQLTSALNTAIFAPVHAFGGVTADVFTAFQTAAQPYGGKTCVAGLLTTKPGVSPLTCDVHPSQSGQKIIAQTVVSAYQGSGSKAGK